MKKLVSLLMTGVFILPLTLATLVLAQEASTTGKGSEKSATTDEKGAKKEKKGAKKGAKKDKDKAKKGGEKTESSGGGM